MNDSLALQVVVVCTALLYAKFVLTAIKGGSKKFKSSNRPPEDEIARLILAWGSALAHGNTAITVVATIVFTVARTSHTLAYANGIFYLRIASYALSLTSAFVLAGNCIGGAFSS
ncbi:hypothetical protein THRCLA_21044 [Thraustotheca clavata]|uniref:Uncharacterized protein n=1 Tax=Thraustotheca clavata TaxID=74557 RepID=A0A1W0A0S4_9STRA|nr:hypothetical protein THRCLA_21044 [Thraustotheca clavata]